MGRLRAGAQSGRRSSPPQTLSLCPTWAGDTAASRAPGQTGSESQPTTRHAWPVKGREVVSAGPSPALQEAWVGGGGQCTAPRYRAAGRVWAEAEGGELSSDTGQGLTSPLFSSVAQSCLILCDTMDCSTPGFPVLHCLPEPAQVHVH